MIKLVIATANRGKVRDFQHIFDEENMSVEVISIEQFGGMPDVAETEPDFKGNARLKADAARSAMAKDQDLWVLADDSGLSVDSLDGEPGVHSARFAGPDATDGDNRKKLLSLLEGKSTDERKAHFTCNLCLISPAGDRSHFEGKCCGNIAFSTSGNLGFGYDSLFIPTGSSKTWGDSDPELKKRESHRGQAAKKMLKWLRFHGNVKK